MTHSDTLTRLNTAMDTLTALDTLTRARTGQKYTSADITAAKKALGMVVQLIEAGAYDVTFQPTKRDFVRAEEC